MAEKIIIYMLIPLCEYDRFHKGEVVSYCKIGQTSVHRYSDDDYIEALYNRTNKTYFPEMMISVGYILSDKNNSYGDGYVRKKLLENSNQSTMILSSQLCIKNNERKNYSPIIVNPGNEFVYNITKSDLENLKDKLYNMNIHNFCIYDKFDIDYSKLPIYKSYRYVLRNKDEDDKKLFINDDRYKQKMEDEMKDKEKWKDNFFKLLDLYLLKMIPNKKDLDDVKFAIDAIKLFSLENEKMENISKIIENIGLKNFDCIFDEKIIKEDVNKRKSKPAEQYEQHLRELNNISKKYSYQYPSMMCEDCSTADYGNSTMPKEFFDSLKDILKF